MNKPQTIYRLLDNRGRITLPREMRETAEMESGDIIKLGLYKGSIIVKKADLIELGDQSPEAIETYVFAAVKTMPQNKQMELASRLFMLIEQGKTEKDN